MMSNREQKLVLYCTHCSLFRCTTTIATRTCGSLNTSPYGAKTLCPPPFCNNPLAPTRPPFHFLRLEPAELSWAVYVWHKLTTCLSRIDDISYCLAGPEKKKKIRKRKNFKFIKKGYFHKPRAPNWGVDGELFSKSPVLLPHALWAVAYPQKQDTALDIEGDQQQCLKAATNIWASTRSLALRESHIRMWKHLELELVLFTSILSLLDNKIFYILVIRFSSWLIDINSTISFVSSLKKQARIL